LSGCIEPPKVDAERVAAHRGFIAAVDERKL
jgi:hypothetical protein